MIVRDAKTDATNIHRETSAVSALRMGSTGDTGTLLQVLRDSTLVISRPQLASEGKLPATPSGSIEAICIR